MGDGGGDIIIKGGSVEIEFNSTLYTKKNGDPKIHENPNRKITMIQIFADENETEELYTSGDHQEGLRWKVKVTTN